MKLKITGLLVLIALVAGCASAPRGNDPRIGGARYHLIDIQGEPYFLDQGTGTVYSIEKHDDGKFDIHQHVGRVGYMKDAL